MKVEQPLDIAGSEFELRLKEVLHSKVEFIQLIEEDLIAAGGKRIRPRLALLASAALGGVPGEMELALAVELLHSATLLHDDLVDDAEVRRGREAAFRKYGNAVSVLSGDYLLSRVLYLLSQTGRVELVELFAEAAKRLAEGEVLQFQAVAYQEYSEAQYYQIIEGKTAALMTAATEGAALLGNVSSKLRGALREYGHHYGLAFQLRDDYLDLMGEESRLGKPVGGDIREGKITLITLWLLQQYPEVTREILLRRASAPGDLSRLRRLAEEGGAAARMIKTIKERVEQAVASLAPLADSEAKTALEELALAELQRLQ